MGHWDKIINKVVQENPEMGREELLLFYCPREFGFRDFNCEVSDNQRCFKCWSRGTTGNRMTAAEIEAIKNDGD